jgi:hypothetical protein
MKSKTQRESLPVKPKKPLKPLRNSNDVENSAKLSLFDHVKHIRGVQAPDYFNNLSEENQKSFNHFMLLRALSMDDDCVGEMAFLYRYFDRIPSPQFYTLLISLTPKNNRWVPWIKTKIIKHSPDLLNLMSKKFEISKRQANEYVNVLVATNEGLEQLVGLCQAMGLNDNEVEQLFNKKDYK